MCQSFNAVRRVVAPYDICNIKQEKGKPSFLFTLRKLLTPVFHLIPTPASKKEEGSTPSPFKLSILLLSKVHLTGLSVHAVYDGERLELIAQIADNTAALLETLLHGDADALDRTAGLCHDGDQTLQRTAVCQKIVDNKHMVVRTEELLRNDNLILTLMRKGFDLSNINLAVDVDALGLLCETRPERRNDVPQCRQCQYRMPQW